MSRFVSLHSLCLITFIMSHYVSFCLIICRRRRFIGFLARNIKSRVHAEMNLVNRYTVFVAVNRRLIRDLNLDSIDVDLEPDDLKEDEAYPLVPLGSIHSRSNNSLQSIRWPNLRKQNTRQMVSDLDHDRFDNTIRRVLIPMIGPTVYKRNAALHAEALARAPPTYGRAPSFSYISSYFTCVGTGANVTIGSYRFTCRSLWEDRRHKYVSAGTCHSWFAIRVRHVPNYFEEMSAKAERGEVDDDEFDPDEYVYGKFHTFCKLNMQFWNGEDREMAI